MARLQDTADASRAETPSASASPPGAESPKVADFVADNIVACATSAAILSRGLHHIHRARWRACLMCVDDGLRIVRAMCAAKAGRDWIGLDQQVYLRAASWTISRSLMLAVMAVQLGEDVVVPLTRRLDAAFNLDA